MAGSDITIEILKEIRETTRATSARLDSMEVSFNSRLDITNERLEIVTDRLDVMSERLDLCRNDDSRCRPGEPVHRALHPPARQATGQARRA